MFLTHCVMEWIVLTVLSLCLPVWSALKVIQPDRVVSTNGVAQVQCFVQSQSSSPPEELRVTLLKGLHGTHELCSSILNFTEQRQAAVEKEGLVQCSAQMRGGAVEVTVSGLRATDTDMYHCEVEVFYPPPYLRLTGNGTLIHVLGSSDCPVQGAHRQVVHTRDEEEDNEDEEVRGEGRGGQEGEMVKASPVSAPVVVLIILIMFVLIIIISFQTLQCERGRRKIVTAGPTVLHKVDAAAFSCVNIA